MSHQITTTTAAVVDEEKPESAAAAADWRTEKWTACERYAHLLKTGTGADVHFKVGKSSAEVIAAHTFVLITGSSVFEEQIRKFGGFTDDDDEKKKKKPIEVSDVHPGAFRAMLKWLYSDDFSGVTKQNVMDVLYAGKKYMLHGLVNACRQSLFTGHNLDARNALTVVLKHAKEEGFKEDKELIDHCWFFVDTNAIAILESDAFLTLNQRELCELFSRDTFEIDELFLFQSLHLWAAHQCVTAGLEENTCSDAVLRDFIGPAIYQVRFPLFIPEQFTQLIVPTGLLNEKDIIALYVHYNGNHNCTDARRLYPKRFNGRQRYASKKVKNKSCQQHQLQLFRCDRHQIEYYCPMCRVVQLQQQE